MKSILLASVSVVAFAGAAAAEITFAGRPRSATTTIRTVTTKVSTGNRTWR